jgi:hypothetical protein
MQTHDQERNFAKETRVLAVGHSVRGGATMLVWLLSIQSSLISNIKFSFSFVFYKDIRTIGMLILISFIVGVQVFAIPLIFSFFIFLFLCKEIKRRNNNCYFSLSVCIKIQTILPMKWKPDSFLASSRWSSWSADRVGYLFSDKKLCFSREKLPFLPKFIFVLGAFHVICSAWYCCDKTLIVLSAIYNDFSKLIF